MRHRIAGLAAGLALVAVVPAPAWGQSASAPLVVTATVISTCRVAVPVSAEPSRLPTLPVELRCTRGATAVPRVQRPVFGRRIDAKGALIVINF